jgi:hypothetical protein
MTNTTAASFYRWQAAGKPATVLFGLDLMDRLEIRIRESIRDATRRGSEIGGVLGGRVVSGTRPTVLIERFEPVECEYSQGPLYLLSRADRARMEQAVARIEGTGVQVCGFFRSNTRRELVLEEEDQALVREFFPGPNQVCLLVRPFSVKPCVGGLFLRENGRFPAAADVEFSFKRSELVRSFPECIVGEPWGAGDSSAMEKGGEAPPAAKRSEPAAEPPAAVPAGLVGRAGVLSRFKSLGLALVFVVGAGAAYYSIGRSGGAGPTAARDSLNLKLEANAGQLHLSWNRDAAVVAGATRATLTINDGGQKEDVNLDLGTLRSGSVVYSPVSGDASFRLEVFDQKTGMKEAASVRRLAGLPMETAPAGGGAQVEPQTAAPEAQRAQAPAQQAPGAAPVAAVTPVTVRAFDERSLAAHLRRSEPAELPAAPVLESQGNPFAAKAPNLSGAVAAPPPAPVAAVVPPPPPAVAVKAAAVAATPKPSVPAPRIGGQVQEARVVRQFPPVYPATARSWHLDGVVRVIAVVGKDGRVKKATAIGGPEVFRPAAVASVMKWIYSPAILNGEPVESQTQVNVSFHR